MNDLIVNISLQNIPLQKRANLLTFQQNLFHPKINGEDPCEAKARAMMKYPVSAHWSPHTWQLVPGLWLVESPGHGSLPPSDWLAGAGQARPRDTGPVPGPGVTHRGAGILMGAPDTGPAQWRSCSLLLHVTTTTLPYLPILTPIASCFSAFYAKMSNAF